MSANTHRRALSHRISRKTAVVGLTIVAAALGGCPVFAPPSSTALSETEFVSVTASTSVKTPLGAGASSLTDSTWAIYTTSDNTLLFRLRFGPAGGLERLFDSFVLAQPWLGSEVIPDEQEHPTDFPGGSYVFGAYTAEADGSVGVLGVIHGVLLGTHLGTATISFSGAIDNDRIDGTMVRAVTILADTPFPPPGDARFSVYALRER